MAKRKQGELEHMAGTPWPVGIGLGMTALVAVRYGIGWLPTARSNPMLHALGKPLAAGAWPSIAWMIPGICWWGALLSCIGGRRRKHLRETRSGLDRLRWRQCGMLVGEAFRRRGYAIGETGLGGADGGVDPILRRDGKSALARRRPWKTQRGDVRAVREMSGMPAHHGTAAVKIVAVGDYAADAQRVARDQPIERPMAGRCSRWRARTRHRRQPGHRQRRPNPPLRPRLSRPLHPIPSPRRAAPTRLGGRSNLQTADRFRGGTKHPACRGSRAA